MLLPQPTAAEAADIIAIQQLAVGYAEAISRGEVDEAVQVYAPDGVLASPTTEDADLMLYYVVAHAGRRSRSAQSHKSGDRRGQGRRKTSRSRCTDARYHQCGHPSPPIGFRPSASAGHYAFFTGNIGAENRYK
jgi:hypothetical protein